MFADADTKFRVEATGHSWGNWVVAALGHNYLHTSDCIHQKQGVGPYTVGQQITLNVTTLCPRCQAVGDTIQTTGTVTQIHNDYPDFCEYSCSCGHVGTY